MLSLHIQRIYKALFLKFLFILCVATFSQQQLSALKKNQEHRVFHRPFASYAMGGTGVVSHQGSEFMSMNPANLRYLNRNHGWDITLLGLQVQYSEGFVDLYRDLNNAVETLDKIKQTIKTAEVLNQYRGKKFSTSFGLESFVLAKRLNIENRANFFRNTSFGIMPLANLDVFTRVNGAMPSVDDVVNDLTKIKRDFEVLDVVLFGYSGVLLAFAKDLDNIPLTLGANIKLMNTTSFSKRFSVEELMEKNDLNKTFEKVLLSGQSTSIDFGAIHRLYQGNKSFFEWGIAINNLGNLESKSSIHIPQTVNLGSYYSFNILDWTQASLHLDYNDLTNSYNDNDPQKRLQLGFVTEFFKYRFFDLRLQAGLKHGKYFTYGVQTLLGIIELGYASYYEENGSYSGEDPIAKQALRLAIRW